MGHGKKINFLVFFWFFLHTFTFKKLSIKLLFTYIYLPNICRGEPGMLGGIFFPGGYPPIARCGRLGRCFPRSQCIPGIFLCHGMSPGAVGSQGKGNSHDCYTQGCAQLSSDAGMPPRTPLITQNPTITHPNYLSIFGTPSRPILLGSSPPLGH